MLSQSTVLASDDFDSLIDDIANHFKGDRRGLGYRAGSDDLVALYEGLQPVSFAVTALSDSGDNQVVNDFVRECKTDLEADNKVFKDKTSEYTTALQSSRKEDDFDRRIDEMADKAKQDNAAAIDKWREKAKKLHKQFPAASNAIAFAFQSVCSLAGKIYTAIINFFSSIVENVAKWLENAWSSIKSFFSTLSNTISGWI